MHSRPKSSKMRQFSIWVARKSHVRAAIIFGSASETPSPTEGASVDYFSVCRVCFLVSHCEMVHRFTQVRPPHESHDYDSGHNLCIFRCPESRYSNCVSSGQRLLRESFHCCMIRLADVRVVGALLPKICFQPRHYDHHQAFPGTRTL